MKNVNSPDKSTRFWSGFSFGLICAGLFTWSFGTKKGRKCIQEILDLSEHHDVYSAKLSRYINMMVDHTSGNEEGKLPTPAQNLISRVREFSRQKSL